VRGDVLKVRGLAALDLKGELVLFDIRSFRVEMKAVSASIYAFMG
jgi:hypothetical protein